MNCKSLLRKTGKTLLAAMLTCGSLNIAEAQVLLSGPYSQNFDGLPTATTSSAFTSNVTIPGWYATQNGVAATSIVGGDGNTATAGLRSFGTTTDRALGGVRNSGNFYYGVRLKNNTNSNINSFTIQYTVEQWNRTSGNPSTTIGFEYKKNATDLSGTGWQVLATGNVSWNPGGGGGGVSDGNITNTTHTFVLNISLVPNEEIVLRWLDANPNDFYLGLDDISITPSVDAVAPIYYSKANATNLTLPASWGTSSDGNGTAPTNFNSGMFVVANKTTATLTSNWSLAAGTKVLISEGTFTIPAGLAINNATVDVADNATLQITGTVPTLGSMGNASTVIFNAAGAQDVPGKTYGNLTISNSGTKVIKGKTTVNGALTLTNSDLKSFTDTDTLVLGTNATLNETTSFYYKGRMLKPVTINGAGSTTFGGMGLTFNNVNGGNWGLVKVTRTTNTAIINPNDDTKESIMRSWHIVPQFQAGTNVNMTFKWLTTEDNGQNYGTGQVQPWKSTDGGQTWVPVGNLVGVTTSGSERTVALTTNSFSIWTFSGTNNPLPVSWLYFKGKAATNGNDLNWATATEKNAAEFIVERSADGKSFEAIGNVKAAGNSNQVLTYNFTDKQPLTAATAYYRLKQTDNDGAFEYSSIIAIARNDKFTEVANAYPNPFGQTLNLQLSQGHGAKKAVLLSIEGKELYSKNLTSATETELNDLPNLKAGFYLLQLIGENETTTLKVMRQ